MRLASFERGLVDARIRLVKLWLHQPREELDKRLKKARQIRIPGGMSRRPTTGS